MPANHNVSYIDLTGDDPRPMDPPIHSGREGTKPKEQRNGIPSTTFPSSYSTISTPIVNPSTQVPSANPTFAPNVPGMNRVQQNGQPILSPPVIDLTQNTQQSFTASSGIIGTQNIVQNSPNLHVSGPINQTTHREDPRKMFLEQQAQYEAYMAAAGTNLRTSIVDTTQHFSIQRPSGHQVHAQQAPMGGVPLHVQAQIQQPRALPSANDVQHNSQQARAPQLRPEQASTNAVRSLHQGQPPQLHAGQVHMSGIPVQQTMSQMPTPSPQVRAGQLSVNGKHDLQQAPAPQIRPGQFNIRRNAIPEVQQTQAQDPSAQFRAEQQPNNLNRTRQAQYALSPQPRLGQIPTIGVNSMQQAQAQQRNIVQLQMQQYVQAPVQTQRRTEQEVRRRELQEKIQEYQERKRLVQEKEKQAREEAARVAAKEKQTQLAIEANAAAAKEQEKILGEKIAALAAEKERLRLEKEAHISDLLRPRTQEEHDLERHEIASNQYRYILGKDCIWSPELLSALLFPEHPSKSSAILKGLIAVEFRAQAFFTAAPPKLNRQYEFPENEFPRFLDENREKLETALTSAVSMAVNEPPSQIPMLKSVRGLYNLTWTPEMERGSRLAEKLTVPLMEKLRLKFPDIKKVVYGFERFYMELNSTLHEGKLCMNLLMRSFMQGVIDLAERSSKLPEFRRDWKLLLKRSELPMSLYGSVVTNRAERLFLSVENKEYNYSREIPLCAIASESTTYPQIVGELLIQAHHYPHSSHQHQSLHVCTVYCPFIDHASGSINVAIYAAPIHALRYMADRASGHLPSQVHAHHASTDHKAFYATRSSPREMKMKAPESIADFDSEYYPGIKGWNQISMHVCNLGKGPDRREAAEVLLRVWMQAYLWWEEKKASGPTAFEKEGLKRQMDGCSGEGVKRKRA